MEALIGYTGFVGSHLNRQHIFDKVYNSSNIEAIADEAFDLVVCAGVSGTKWLANKNPQEDLQRIDRLLTNLSKVKCKKMILISTVDVYKNPIHVNEQTPINLRGLHAYGRNRLVVEEFIRDTFEDHHIIRLPAIYGEGIKKNFVFDLLHNHCLEWTHRDSVFQFYYLENLWKDIRIALEHNIETININTEPIKASVLAGVCFDKKFNHVTERPPLNYDVRSIYTHLFNKGSDYMYDKEQIFHEMKTFIKTYNL